MKKELKEKKLLVLGGTLISCEIIRKAKEMGLFVGVADYNEIQDSPGKQIADKAHLISATDIKAVVELIKKEKYDGVLCGFADVLLPCYSIICKEAGLPCYGTLEQFETFIDKDKYKNLLRQYGIPTVKEYNIDLENLDDMEDSLVYPLMVKPVDSSGARGITICHCFEELKSAIEKANEFSKLKKHLVEQYLEGKEVTVFWVFQDGKRYLTCIGNRHVKQNQEGVIPLPVGYTYPASITENYIKSIEPKVQKMFEEIDIQNGMMFMQCKVENDECIVYDIGYRLTGSLEYKMLKKICDYDPLEMMINFAVNGSMGEPLLEQKVDPFLKGIYGYNVSILCKPGIINKIIGCEKLTNYKDVIDVVLAHNEGEEITDKMKGLLSQITVRILGSSDTISKLKEDMYNIYDAIKIFSENGDSLKLSGMDDADFDGVII